jgi:hypothetical protein
MKHIASENAGRRGEGARKDRDQCCTSPHTFLLPQQPCSLGPHALAKHLWGLASLTGRN